MKLIFTRKQEEQKKKIINNVQTDLLYKLVIDYLDLKQQDKNQIVNKYIIDQFNSLEKILDIIDEVNNGNLALRDSYHKINEIGLPLDLEEMEKFLKQNSYYQAIFNSYIFLLEIMFDEESKNIFFLEIYNSYEKKQTVTPKKTEKKSIQYSSIQKTLNKANKNHSTKDLSELVKASNIRTLFSNFNCSTI